MNKEQQHFVSEMLRHGDKTKAYRTAYPDAKTDKAVESSVNRLLKNPEVKEAIDEPTNRLRAEAKAEVEAELKEKMKAELMTFHEAQVTLTNIIRGTHITEKWVKEKEGWKTIEVKPTQSNILSALNQFFRLNNHYPQKKTADDRKAEKAAAAREISEKWMREERPKIPAWPTDNPFRHPWGDIYPPEYKGPFFDPKDPNTREQFLAITEPYRLSKLAKEKEAQNSQHASPAELRENTTTHNNQGRHFERSETREKSPEPMLADRPERQDNTANSQEISSPESIRDRNDDRFSAQQNTTTERSELMSTNEKDIQQRITHNNQESSFPVVREGGPQGRKGNTQHGHDNTTEHNNIQPEPSLEEQIAIKYKRVSPKVRQSLLRDALRKEGWQTLNDAYNEVYNFYLMNQHSGGIKLLKWYEKARDSRNHPPHLRLPIEKETGWTIHPKYPNMMKKTRPLKW